MLVEKQEMKIKGQSIVEDSQYLTIELEAPYWSAWQKFHWKQGVEGFGLSKDLVIKSIEKNKPIKITYPYGSYCIDGRKVQEICTHYNSTYTVRGKITLMIIPRSECERIVEYTPPVIVKPKSQQLSLL